MAGCGTWIGLTPFIHRVMALDEFIFTIDPAGKAVMVEISALRLPVEKASS